LQLRRLQEQDQPWEQLDEVIEEINRLMLKSAETASKEKLGREKAAAAAAQRKQQQQQNGADGKLQRLIWDPGGFPTATGEAHEQELMIFAAVEYDAGASLHAASQPASHVSAHAFKC
jgi:hypothetical protein